MKNLLRSFLLLSILLFCASVNTEAQTAFRLFAGTFAQRPTTCVAADVYWSTNTSHFYIGAGAPCSWVDFGTGSAGAGTVSSVSVVSANGFAGTVATATTTPAITLSTTITGLLKGNGTAISAASAGTDYIVPGGALGTPSSGVATNLTGTAASLTAGSVTTNANLTGVITSSGNATSIASQTGTGTKFVVDTNPTLAGLALSGTISGGGNQINNVIIGTTTPLAGLFTTLSGSTSVTSPIHTNAGAMAITTTASNGNITLTPNGTGIISTAKALVQPNNSLTDNGSTIATNASLGNNFRVTALTASVTLSNPTNLTDGQIITWEVIQNASAAKTLAFDTSFAFGAEITGCTISATLSSHNFVTGIWNSTTSKLYVRGCLTGY